MRVWSFFALYILLLILLQGANGGDGKEPESIFNPAQLDARQWAKTAADAYIFGIELVPCIQTLAHLHNALKWQGMENIKDTADILEVGKEETYVFIEKLLRHVKESFSTRRVHFGMDEAVSLGLVNYLKNKGYEKSSVLIKNIVKGLWIYVKN